MSEPTRRMMFDAFLAGFGASGEGFDAEYPFSDKGWDPRTNDSLIREFDRWYAATFVSQETENRP